MRRDRLAGLASLVLAAALPATADATDGYFSVGTDDQTKGLAGVGVSSANGVAATAVNPALGVKAGNSAGGGLSFFIPRRDVTNSGGSLGPPADIANGHYTSSDGLFLIPYLGVNYQLDDSTAASLLLYANGGLNTHYLVSPFTGSGGQVGVDLAQVFITPTLSKKIGYGISLGVGPVFAVQRFAAQGLQPFQGFSSDPGALTNNGYDYSYGIGLRLGAAWDAADWLTFGAAYQSRTWMTSFDKYSGLFADQGSFDIPALATAGVTFRPLDTLEVSLQYQHIFYGEVNSIANPGTQLQLGIPLGASGGPGFGWKDMNVFALGVQWKATPQLVLRAGYSHASNFTTAQNALFNILAPATIKDHLALGVGYDITPNWNVGLAYVHAFSNKLNGYNQNDPTQSITLHMVQDEVTLGATYRF
jgi:long-chain fatty acid transport protein